MWLYINSAVANFKLVQKNFEVTIIAELRQFAIENADCNMIWVLRRLHKWFSTAHQLAMSTNGYHTAPAKICRFAFISNLLENLLFFFIYFFLGGGGGRTGLVASGDPGSILGRVGVLFP